MRHFHIDRIVALERGVRAEAVRGVSLSDDVFAEHFPGNPVLPGVYLLEGLAQTAGVLLWETTERKRVALMVSVDRARFFAFVRPGDVVRLIAEVESLDDSAASIRGTADVGGTQVATARIVFALQDIGSLVPPLYQPYWAQSISVWLGEYEKPAHA